MVRPGLRRLARPALDFIETRRTRRALGRRFLLPRLVLIRPGEDPERRWREVYPDFATRQNLERVLGEIWLVATHRRAYGGLLLSPVEWGLLLHTMRVRRPWRGLGIAGELLRQVLEISDERDATIWLQVSPDNRPAIRLYRSHGFEEFDPPPGLRREGHLVMRRVSRKRGEASGG